LTVPRRREDDARSFDLFKQAQTMSRELIVLPDDTAEPLLRGVNDAQRSVRVKMSS